jgi:putative colanic acid biosynthesis acetyltransferase WcaF
LRFATGFSMAMALLVRFGLAHAQLTGEHSVISQNAYLCAGTHDHSDISFPLVASPITIEPECWIAARAFVGPGVRTGCGAVIGACSVVLADVPPATIVAGVPARTVGIRKVRSTAEVPQGPDAI